MSGIIIFDIETTNLKANFGHILCFGYKELGKKRTKVLSISDYPSAFAKDPTNDYLLCKDISKILSDADAWITWYGIRFDVPFIQTRLLDHGLPTIPNTPHIDGWRTARYKMCLNNNRLATVQSFLELPDAKTAICPKNWRKAIAGNKSAIKYVRDHCKYDVLVLEQAYEKIRPLVVNHPNLNLLNKTEKCCSYCGSKNLRYKGEVIAHTRIYDRYHCLDCNSYPRARSAKKILIPEIRCA